MRVGGASAARGPGHRRRYRPASRKIRSAARAGWAPPAAPEILAKEVRVGAPGIPNPALRSSGLTGAGDCQDASFRGPCETRRAYLRRITTVTPSRAAECRKAAQHPRVTNQACQARPHPRGGLMPTSPAAPLPSGRLARADRRGVETVPRWRRAVKRFGKPTRWATADIHHYIGHFRRYAALSGGVLLSCSTPDRSGVEGRTAPGTPQLLERDRGAGALQGLLGLVGGLLVDLLQDWLGSAVNKILGLLQAQAGERRGPP